MADYTPAHMKVMLSSALIFIVVFVGVPMMMVFLVGVAINAFFSFGP